MNGLNELGKIWLSTDLPFWNNLPEQTQGTLTLILGILTLLVWGGAVGTLITGIVKWVHYSRQKSEGEIDTKVIKPFKVFGWYILLFAILVLLPFIVRVCMEIAKASIGV